MQASISFVSCVSDADAYQRWVAASLQGSDCERIAIDNAGNTWSASQALNMGWERARGDLLVFCHQDVEFPPGWIDTMREQIGRIDRVSGGNWGIAGTFGRSGRRFLGHVDDLHGKRREGEELPAPVETLDEHCLIARRALPLRFDESLDGYHLYGVDICLQALALGMANYAIDACVRHLGRGEKDVEYYRLRNQLERKWRRRRFTSAAWHRVPAKLYGPSGPLHLGLRHAFRYAVR
jgi:glycosyl transferase family 2